MSQRLVDSAEAKADPRLAEPLGRLDELDEELKRMDERREEIFRERARLWSDVIGLQDSYLP